MQLRAPKRTRDRILESSLRLFNAVGEPNVSCAAIADDMQISPGNLHYHFRNKDDIVITLFEQFEHELDEVLNPALRTALDLDGGRRFVRRLFETIWRHRFLHRDLNELLSRNRRLETRYGQLQERTRQACRALCASLAAAGVLQARDEAIDSLATSMVLIATYWPSFEYVTHARRFGEPAFQQDAMARGQRQLFSLLMPLLSEDARDRLAQVTQAPETANRRHVTTAFEPAGSVEVGRSSGSAEPAGLPSAFTERMAVR